MEEEWILEWKQREVLQEGLGGEEGGELQPGCKINKLKK